MNLVHLEKEVTACSKCDRLTVFRERIAKEKRKSYMDWDYWGKAVPGYGKPDAKLMILGLAPAAHGGNRTGRVFTGDKSADFLFKCLHHVGLANQPNSDHRDDGLELNGYITAAVKCVPPGDKPLNKELDNCSKYFDAEISNLNKLQIIITLGKVAFENCLKFYKKKYTLTKKMHFKHGKSYLLPDNVTLIPSYHPSPRNVNTKLISEKMMVALFKRAKKISKT